MLPRQVLNAALSRVTEGCFKVRYWDGVTECFGTGEPQFTIHFRDAGALDLLAGGIENGFSDGYIQGRIEVEGDVADVVATAMLNVDAARGGLLGKFINTAVKLQRRRSLDRQKKDVASHYDLGNDFFRLYLDPSMTYSCAYFSGPGDSLEDAQRRKVDLCLRKLRLKPGETLLDIGSGWGSAIIRAAEKCGASAFGITLSEEQLAGSRAFVKERGLEGRVSVALQNYSELAKEGRTFDKILSVGMIEHVGQAHLAEFAASVERLLAPGGIALLHHITSPMADPPARSGEDGFTERIFPGTYIPTLVESLTHLVSNGFRILNVENLREHYRMTLDRWSDRYEANFDTVRGRFGDEFARKWRLYLRGCSAAFRVGTCEVHQILVSKGVTDAVPLTMADVYSQG
ncbi:MAG TPA: class I SAM-dependent methyltransferase [Armatimonadota bacterium]|jgi:cyclopropane-fatty-acyl-phospholipid synthase